MLRELLLLIFFLALIKTSAQTTIKVTDARTGKGLAQATLRIDNIRIVTNDDGLAILPKDQEFDNTLIIASYLGYQQAAMTLMQLRQNQLTLKLGPIAYELQEVAVKSISRNPDTIMALVKRNLATNYKGAASPIKNTLFIRTSTLCKPIQAEAEMSKSTKVAKKDLDKVNAELKVFTSNLIKHPPQKVTDMLADYYTAIQIVNGKKIFNSKLLVRKGISFKEDKLAPTPEDTELRGMALLMSHLDTTKLYRIKSGIFGTRDTVIGGKKVKRENPNLRGAKSQIIGVSAKSNLTYNHDFVTKQELYEYTFAGVSNYEEGNYLYRINFSPRKRKAKYAGTLYISPTDYAIVRVDYQLADGKVKSGLNLKFILGVKHADNISKGTLVYEQKACDKSYYLKYASSDEGAYMYINRPLKFIEITDGGKEKVSYDIKVEGDIITRTEYLCLTRAEIAETEFDEAFEKEFAFDEPHVYDAKVWDKYVAENPVPIIESLKKPE
ncbi:carboxypeptidase-like regulatory domain-containing protein [Flavobacterium sp. J372]|uniref:carboxypeptidase-like regulatory domain-containing protein n=1 Tax=Flavobacterium sp. J372 TaxID=2898436 RepID=UPI002151C45E|nr:carboxypeptidase-like regulatory domain-containing protein [Flavobacterium sp. J372]MCR5862706.1 carboxypeptidase-like regulatory domain-containing protein [Flavobacterium sp. J372]